MTSDWYPPRRFSDMFLDENTANTINENVTPIITPKISQPSPKHWKFDTGELKYIHTNKWALNLTKQMKENCRRHTIHGVIVKDLAKNHPLYGEQGLYTTKKFEKFDVIGEYLGIIVGPEVKSGHYLAALEDKSNDDSLGLDAATCGNEMRFINSYIGIDFSPNVTMRTVYMNTYPHLVIVATRDIEIGEELLLDYGDAYNQLYILKKTEEKKLLLDFSTVRSALPGMISDSSSSDDDDDNDRNIDKNKTNDDENNLQFAAIVNDNG